MATEEWKEEVLRAHNDVRARHGAPPLTWSDECYESALKQAAVVAAGGPIHGHQEGASGAHGQNTFWWTGAPTPTQAVEFWYKEFTTPGYDFASPGMQGGACHFTQLVWVATEHVGMAASEEGGKRSIVANYFPQGNWCMPGFFEKNVLPLDSAMVTRTAEHSQHGGHHGGPGGGAHEAPGAGVEGTVTASEMTPEMEALFEGCPFPEIKDQVVQAFAQGGEATVTRAAKRIDISCNVSGYPVTNYRWWQ